MKVVIRKIVCGNIFEIFIAREFFEENSSTIHKNFLRVKILCKDFKD